MQGLYVTLERFKKFIDSHIVHSENPQYIERKQAIIQELRRVKPPVDASDVRLYKIYDVLIGPFAQLRMPKNEIDYFHREVYKFFNAVVKIRSPDKYFKFYPTKLYEDFMKGISLFANTKVDDRPSYHREGSCGSKTVNYTTKFTYLPNDTKEVRERKVAALKQCLIERKIYNDIYNHILHEQDGYHMVELAALERLFMDYTQTTIQTRVRYKQDYMPYLVLIDTFKNGFMISTASYTRTVNEDVIHKEYNTQRVSPSRTRMSVNNYDDTPRKVKSV